MAESKLKSSIMKSLETITESLKSLETRIKALEEPPAPVVDEEVIVEEEKSKEEARSDIEGSADAGSPEDANPDANNEVYVFKALSERLEKLENAVETKKSQAPRAVENTTKSTTINPVDLATGAKKMTFREVHKAAKEAWR